MDVFGNTVFYSDWGLQQVSAYHVNSDAQSVMASNVARPAGIVVYHPEGVEGMVFGHIFPGVELGHALLILWVAE